MRIVLFAAGILVIFSGLGLAASGDEFDRSLQRAGFETVDWTLAREHWRHRIPANSDEDSEALIERNLRFIFFNKLNRRRFVVAPPPQSVVDRMVKVLRISDQLGLLVREARSEQARTDALVQRDLLGKIGRTAHQLKEEFNGFFLEGHSSAYSLVFPREQTRRAQWAFFLLQSQRLESEIDTTLADYFFNATPGSISLGQFRNSTINTLTDSLTLLAETVRKRMNE